MAKYTTNLLLILASPIDEQDQRLKQISNLCTFFGKEIITKGVNVDFIDLYKDREFVAGDYLDSNDSKVLEYQIRLNKADHIVIFHPVFLDGVPAILKGFLENILSFNFAFRTENRINIPLLTDKKLTVFAFDNRTRWISKYVYGNQLGNFWYKTVFEMCGFVGRLEMFDNFRSSNESDIQNWYKILSKTINKIRPKPTLLDFDS
jgi:NAD(P)H dehydrogenase (quinone)